MLTQGNLDHRSTMSLKNKCLIYTVILNRYCTYGLAVWRRTTPLTPSDSKPFNLKSVITRLIIQAITISNTEFSLFNETSISYYKKYYDPNPPNPSIKHLSSRSVPCNLRRLKRQWLSDQIYL